MTQKEKVRATARANAKTYHLVDVANKNLTRCGKPIQVGDGKPQVLLSSSETRAVGKICTRCQNPGGAAATKVKKPTGERAARVAIPAGKIRILAEKNPRRAGTTAFKMFELYRNGITPAEFYSLGGRVSDIRWDISRKFIEIK